MSPNAKKSLVSSKKNKSNRLKCIRTNVPVHIRSYSVYTYIHREVDTLASRELSVHVHTQIEQGRWIDRQIVEKHRKATQRNCWEEIKRQSRSADDVAWRGSEHALRRRVTRSCHC